MSEQMLTTGELACEIGQTLRASAGDESGARLALEIEDCGDHFVLTERDPLLAWAVVGRERLRKAGRGVSRETGRDHDAD